MAFGEVFFVFARQLPVNVRVYIDREVGARGGQTSIGASEKGNLFSNFEMVCWLETLVVINNTIGIYVFVEGNLSAFVTLLGS